MFSVLKIIKAIILCLLLVASTIENNPEDMLRIVNGRPATLGQIPFQVSLKQQTSRGSRFQKSGYSGICGGTVIGKRLVLTAGHCVVQKGNVCQKACNKVKITDLRQMYAVAGTLTTYGQYKRDGAGSEQWRKIDKAIVPPQYKFPKNDIAVLHISPKFVINEYVKVIAVAKKHMDYGAIECQISGYGRTSSSVVSPVLLWATVNLEPTKTCSIRNKKDMSKFVCLSSAAGVSNVLQGDSGGPLLCKNTGDPNDRGQGVVVGVVSAGKLDKFSGRWKTFFTRVTSYRSFLLEASAAKITCTADVIELLFVCFYTVVNYIRFGYSNCCHFSFYL